MDIWQGIVAVGLIGTAIAVFMLRSTILGKLGPTVTPPDLSADVARLQERERSLVAEVSEQRELRAKASDALSSMQSANAESREKLAAAQQAELELRDRLGRTEAELANKNQHIRVLEGNLLEHQSTTSRVERALAGSVEREEAQKRTIAEKDQQLQGLESRLKIEFENIANRVLASASEQLTDRSKDTISNLLEPLKERISTFQQTVESAHTDDIQQRATLAEQIRQAALLNRTIGTQAENLTKALKSDSQVRGRWGEISLERILEASGLHRGRDFVVQSEGLEIRNEIGGLQRPDVVVLLPESRHFVIDSKISLVDFEVYVSAETEEQQTSALRKLASSVRTHIDDLAGKKYQYASGINAHEVVLLFTRLEGALALAVQADKSLFEYAWQRRVVLVSPSSLFMVMRTVDAIWRYQRQNQNAREIAIQAGLLYDKLSGVVNDFNVVAERIEGAASAHNEAMRKLAFGRGNALSRAEKFKALGVGTKKEVPLLLIDGQKMGAETDEDTSTEELVSPDAKASGVS